MGIIVSQVAVWQHSLLEGVVLRCWQCLWTGRCWVWTSPACHKGKALNPWWRVDRRLPLRRQGCKEQFKATLILPIQIHINHNSFFIFKTHHLPGIYTPWISHSYSYNSLSRYNECSRTTLWRTLRRELTDCAWAVKTVRTKSRGQVEQDSWKFNLWAQLLCCPMWRHLCYCKPTQKQKKNTFIAIKSEILNFVVTDYTMQKNNETLILEFSWNYIYITHKQQSQNIIPNRAYS